MTTDTVKDLLANLQHAIGFEQVKFDQMTRLLYSTDASNYQIVPIGVTFPRHADDVSAIHEIANQHRTPLLPRGGGSSLAGQAVGKAIVMDFSRYMRRVRSINAETQTITVESGLILSHLNQQVQSLGLMYGPDPASAERATVGGCVANNSTGAHSILYGMTADNIQRLEVALASGERVWLDESRESLNKIRQMVGQLAIQHADEIAARYPKTFRTVAGYALNKIDPANVNLNWLLAGSEGTLATIVQAELNLVKRPTGAEKRLALVHFATLRESLEATPRIMELQPSAIELMDRMLMTMTRRHPQYSRRLNFVDGDPEVVLIVEFYGASSKELDAKIQSLKDLLRRIGHKGSITYAISPAEQSNIWSVRAVGLGLLMSERSAAKPIPFIEDAAVPVEHLADYIDDVADIIRREGTTFAIYAHASAGCLHVRPLINLKTVQGHQQYRAIGDAVAQVVMKYHGTITGEHGKGIARGEYGELLFGPQLTQAFRQIKQAFDPHNLMNPGKIIDPPKMDDPTLMRYTPEYELIPIQTRFDWDSEGGFDGAVEMCNGAGVCRKEGVGTMCPSYMATLDEAHATRGRANALRQAMAGKLGADGMTSKAVFDVFDLCLACKACKAECPSSVDVARIKAEFLANYYDTHGAPFSTRLFANIHRLNHLGSLTPRLSNWMLGSALGRIGAKMLGLPTERPLPKLAKKRFSQQVLLSFSSEAGATLVIDTFTEYNHPEIGLALLKIAEKLELPLNIIRLPAQGCCGRPAISKGLLAMGKQMATANVRYLSGLAGPFLFLEPSCLSAFIDEYPVLVDKSLQEIARRVAEQCISAEAWLVQKLERRDIVWDRKPRKLLLHGHCHQKSLWGTKDTLRCLQSIPEANVTEIDSGCCGVAGSFGYEHYDLSLKIAEQRLLPAIRSHPDAIPVAPGTSCRTQLHDAGFAAYHPVEIVAQAMAVSRNSRK
jgi:FAD/FMN-containing dehydrogenase/Fe-S oxidoreductase